MELRIVSTSVRQVLESMDDSKMTSTPVHDTIDNFETTDESKKKKSNVWRLSTESETKTQINHDKQIFKSLIEWVSL